MNLKVPPFYRPVTVDGVVDLLVDGALERLGQVLWRCGLGVGMGPVVVQTLIRVGPNYRGGLFTSAGVHLRLVKLKRGGGCTPD